MLRITETEATDGRARLRLEGSLCGPWVAELQRLARQSDSGARIALDVSALRFVDSTGARVLLEMSRRGSRLEGVTPYITALLAGLEEGTDERNERLEQGH